MTSDEKLSIESLVGAKNWPVWKFKMQALLESNDLWDYVDGSAVRGDTQAAQAKFDRAQRKARATLVLQISSNLIYLITDCETPQAVWNKLKEHFERDTMANKLFLKKQFFSLKMREGSSMQNHLRRMKEITDQLASIKAPIPEEEHMVALLLSLPKSYEMLVTVMLAKGSDLQLSVLQEALLSEEEKRCQVADKIESDCLEGKGSDGNESALRHEATKYKLPRCYACGEEGHINRFCPHKKWQGGTRTQMTSRSYGRHRAYDSEGERPSTHKASQAEEEEGVDLSGDAIGDVFVGGSARYGKDDWIVDSGASRHMTPNRGLLISYREFATPERVRLGDGRTLEVLGSGKVKVRMLLACGNHRESVMIGVLYVPKLACNLFSVRAAAINDKVVQFGHSRCWIKDSKRMVVGRGRIVNRMYQLDCEVHDGDEWASVANEASTKLDLWHRRMGHVNGSHLKSMINKGLIHGVDIAGTGELDFCEPCAEGKSHRGTFKPVGEIRSTERLQLVHSDVAGPMKTESLGGARYFVTFIDDFSRCVTVYPIKHKSDVLEKFKEWEALVTTYTGTRIKTLRTDNGGEYCSDEFETFLKERGILHQTTAPHTPQQNGVAERMNRTLQDAALSMILHAGVSKGYWAEAVCTAAYVRNRVITTSTGKTPYERWYDKKPDVSHMRVFGCAAYAHVPEVDRTKFDPKAIKMRFVGYCLTRKAYRLYDEQKRKLFFRRDVRFNESDFGNDNQQTKATGGGDAGQSADDEEPASDQPVLRRSSRNRKEPSRYAEEYLDVAEVQHTAFHMTDVAEPATLKEALASENHREWKEATDAEYQSLIENDTWDLTELPAGRKAIGCKWVFKVKYAEEGQVERFKGRLVAKGFLQKHGIDYDETFSPVVRFSSIRTLLAFAISRGMHIHQMDVVTAFLNGELDEEIYMQQPEGYVRPGEENLVCRLRKSLYGLKQSSRCWNKTFREFLQNEGFKQSAADPCVFIRESEEGLAVVAVYVDDLFLLTDTEEEMSRIKSALTNRFKMKDMGKLHFCLGISILQGRGVVRITQKQYITKLLKKFGLLDAKPASTPMALNVKLDGDDDGCSKPVESGLYQSMTGSLLYAAMATRPDIAQAVGVLAKFNSKPTELHLTAVKRVFRYLKGTADMCLEYRATGNHVEGFSDADWASNSEDRRSTTGSVFVLAGGAISWASQRQATVALSTSEAEYMSLCLSTQEAVWLRRLLSDLGVNCSQPTVIHEDNQGAIAIAKNPVGHKRTKHIDIKYHFVREKVLDGTIGLQYCPTEEMLADILTKPIGKERFQRLRTRLGICQAVDC